VHWATGGQSSTPDVDYESASGDLTFAPGETSKTITINIKGDLTDEPDEYVGIVLSAPSNATIARAVGVGRIINDDTEPSISISDASADEGDSGSSNLTFTISLSSASGKTVTVDYATAPGSAAAGTDYTTTAGTVTFAPGETTKTIAVPVITTGLPGGNVASALSSR